MLCSHTQNFTIKKTLIKTFAVVYNQISPFLVTKVLCNERQNIVKNVFYQPITETPKRARRKKTAIENLFCYTQTNTTRIKGNVRLFPSHANAKNNNKGNCKAFCVTHTRKKQYNLIWIKVLIFYYLIISSLPSASVSLAEYFSRLWGNKLE